MVSSFLIVFNFLSLKINIFAFFIFFFSESFVESPVACHWGFTTKGGEDMKRTIFTVAAIIIALTLVAGTTGFAAGMGNMGGGQHMGPSQGYMGTGQQMNTNGRRKANGFRTGQYEQRQVV